MKEDMSVKLDAASVISLLEFVQASTILHC